MGIDLMKQIIQKSKAQDGDRDIEVSIRKVEYIQLVRIEKFIKDQEATNELRRRSFDAGVAVLDINSKDSAQSLADALALSEFNGFTVNMDAVSVNTIEISITGK